MRASILDLRRKMKDIIGALDKNEKVVITHRGKEKGVLYPCRPDTAGRVNVREHPAFGMWKKNKKTVKKQINELRKSRHDF